MTDGLTGTAALLWNLIADSLRGYITRRERFFEHHIESLQDKILLIHKDYTDGFEEIRRSLLDGTRPPIEFVEFLRERRRDLECERLLSRNLATALRRNKKLGMTGDTWKAVESYCRSVVRYFHAGSNIGSVSWYSRFLDFMENSIEREVEDVWERMPIAPDPRQAMLQEVDYVLDKLPKSFERVCERYAVLRTLLL